MLETNYNKILIHFINKLYDYKVIIKYQEEVSILNIIKFRLYINFISYKLDENDPLQTFIILYKAFTDIYQVLL